MIKQTQNKKKVRTFIDQNPVEAFRDLGTGVVSSVKRDVVDGGVDTLWEQFLGGGEQLEEGLSGDLTPGGEINLNLLRETKTQEPVLPGLDYHRQVQVAEVKIVQENEVELKKQISQILFELKQLVNTSQQLQAEFKQVTVETLPAKPGKYHFTFLEWLKNIIRNTRLKVDESRSWLAVFYQKKAKRQYWNMFKKHGTTFGLSHERVVATQTG